MKDALEDCMIVCAIFTTGAYNIGLAFVLLKFVKWCLV